MAFDMYLQDQHETIDNADEYIFALAGEFDHMYPVLGSIWARFYSQFILTPEESELLVHELLALYGQCAPTAGRGFAELTLRLAGFFSRSSATRQSITCAGD